jgi:hypothetical protein
MSRNEPDISQLKHNEYDNVKVADHFPVSEGVLKQLNSISFLITKKI